MHNALTLAAVLIAGVVPQKHKPHTGCNTKACYIRTCKTECIERVKLKHWKHLQWKLPAETKAMLARLRGCETRGIPFPKNYQWAGHHDGAYQYDGPTWNDAGGEQEHAYLASPAEQDVRTARFFPSHRSQWACSA